MAMNFFESQDVARKNSGRLVVLFVIAVLAIMVLVYLLIAATIGYMTRDAKTGVVQWENLLDPWLMLGAGLGTILVVGGGSLFKMMQLRGGGASIAEHLGGRLIQLDTSDADERKTLNVVQEMAIASGTPVPPVYLLSEEDGINAFAAGYSPNDAVIAVSRGCVQNLTRDELQGVIAHEFSHILNGDMRMNIRVIGVLHGILIVGIIGYFILRTFAFSGHRRRSSSKDSGSPLPLLALGAGLMVVGFVGTFFGSWIKAALSRQREYLADASAVQFTRNPDGIAGALKKIGGFHSGSRIESPNAPEASHMFFGQAVKIGLSSLFGTHPPLQDRIKRIDPSWTGDFIEVAGAATRAPAAAGVSGLAGASKPPSRRKRPRRPPPRKKTRAARGAIGTIGRPTQAHIEYAVQLTKSLPQPVVDATRESYGARAVIYALLIDRDAESRKKQLEHLAKNAERGANAETRKLLPIIEDLDAKLRLPLIDLTVPALRALSPGQYEAFRRNVIELIMADDKIDLFEWMLQRSLLRNLDRHFGKAKAPRARYYGLQRLGSECGTLLSTLAQLGHRNAADARTAFDKAVAGAGLSPARVRVTPGAQRGLDALDDALVELAKAAPRCKQQILEACAICISADHEITVREAELFRAVSDALDCPMPPLLPGQPLS